MSTNKLIKLASLFMLGFTSIFSGIGYLNSISNIQSLELNSLAAELGISVQMAVSVGVISWAVIVLFLMGFLHITLEIKDRAQFYEGSLLTFLLTPGILFQASYGSIVPLVTSFIVYGVALGYLIYQDIDMKRLRNTTN